jgi:GYF domain 2
MFLEAQMIWYVSRGDVKRGPISEDEMLRHVQAGHLRPTDMVWRENMPEWKPAAEVNELFKAASFQAATPTRSPPLATSTATASGARPGLVHQSQSSGSSNSYILAHWQGRLGLATSFWLNCVLIGIIFPIVSFLFLATAYSVLPDAAVLLLLLLVLLHIALIVWQTVGLYRCGLAHIFSPRTQFKLWAHLSVIWAAQTVAFVPLVLVAIIGGITALGSSADATFNQIASEIEAGEY